MRLNRSPKVTMVREAIERFGVGKTVQRSVAIDEGQDLVLVLKGDRQ